MNLINTYLSQPECVSCLFAGGSLPDRHNGQSLVMVSQGLADEAGPSREGHKNFNLILVELASSPTLILKPKEVL